MSKFTVNDLLEGRVKAHPFEHMFLARHLFQPVKQPKNKSNTSSKRNQRTAVDMEDVRAVARAAAQEVQARADAEAAKSKAAEEIDKANAARQQRHEDRAQYLKMKAERKAARQARRDAVTWSSSQSRKVFEMFKEGVSFDDIAKEFHNGANGKDCRLHYEAVLANADMVKAVESKGKGEGEKEKEPKPKADKKKDNGDGNGEKQTQEEMIEAGKEAEGEGVKTRGGAGSFTFSKKQINKINGMKKNGKSWKDIASAIGNGATVKDVKNKWKELNPDAGGSQVSADSDDNAGSPDKSKSKSKGKDKTSEKDTEKAFDDYRGMIMRACDFFNEEDCQLLEALVEKHSEERLTSIQSQFQNLTGRMVPLWILEKKLTHWV